jgi:hypothetical protein
MVDWRSAHVGIARLGISQSIEGYTQNLEVKVDWQHPARTWVEWQEQKSVVHEFEQIPTPIECEHHLRQIVTKLEQGSDASAEEGGWTAADPSRYPQQVCRGLARLLSHGKVTSEGARWLARQIGGRLPPRWGSVWMERGCKLEGAIMAIPYTGLSFAASCNSRSSHGQYTRSSTEHFQYGAVTSARPLGQNYRNRNYSKVRNYVLYIQSFSNQTMAPRF